MGGRIKKIPDWFRSLSDKKIYLILAGIIACQLAVMCIRYANYKQESNMDELGSYGQANCSETSIILSKQGSNWDYINKWVSGEHIRDYLTVSEDEVFNYAHIYNDLAVDVHPPLFYYMLHFVCSMFPGKFSYWYGIAINIAAYIVIVLYLYRFLLEMKCGRIQSLFCCACFGFTAGAFDIFSFIRMYAMLTAFTLMYTFYSVKAFHSSDKKKYKWVFLAAVSLYLGIMTQYMIVIYAFILSISFSIYYFLSKKIRMLFAYVLSMITAVLLMPATFPVFFKQFMSGKEQLVTIRYPFFLQLRQMIFLYMNEMYGINTPLTKTMFFFWVRMIIYALLIIYIIMRFLFRKDEWFHRFRMKIRDKLRHIADKLKNSDKVYWVLYVSLLLTVIVMCRVLKLYFFGYTADRYLFFLYPLLYVVLFKLLTKIIRLPWVLASILAFLTILSINRGCKGYTCYFERPYMNLTEVLKGSDTIVVLEGYPTMKRYAKDLYLCDSFFATNKIDYKNYIDEMKLDNDNPKYLLVEKTIDYMGQNQELIDSITEDIKKAGLGDRFEYMGENYNAYIYRLE